MVPWNEIGGLGWLATATHAHLAMDYMPVTASACIFCVGDWSLARPPVESVFTGWR